MVDERDEASLREFVRRVLIVLLLVGLAILIWRASSVLLLVFGAILVAILLRGLAEILSAKTRIPTPITLILVLLLILALITLGVWQIGGQAVEQFSRLLDRLPGMFADLEQGLSETRWGDAFIRALEGMLPSGDGDGSDMLAAVVRGIQSVIDSLFKLILVLFIGVYIAFQPRLNRKGLMLLVPRRRQSQVAEILDANVHSLWWWLVGQAVSMAIIGVLTYIGLMLLGMPMALALALLAGVLEFVPVVGAVVASVPAIIIGFGESPQMGLYVTILYIIIQQIEGNLIQPLVQRRAANLPPVMLLVSIALFGILFGLAGVILAAPLAVVLYVTINMAYVRNVLGHREGEKIAEKVSPP